MLPMFITGTDTSVGKTVVSSFLCYHLNLDYFKPIQTGEDKDSDFVKKFTKKIPFKEAYHFKEAASPHIAAKKENKIINIDSIKLPKDKNLIVEGAGGILVPLNNKHFIVDLIKFLNIPVIIVARTKLGTINHTLLTIEALSKRNIKTLGVIFVGDFNKLVFKTIGKYTNILLNIPYVKDLNDIKSKKYLRSDLCEQLI